MIITLSNCSVFYTLILAESIVVDFCIASGKLKNPKEYIQGWKKFRQKEFEWLFKSSKKPPKFDQFKGPDQKKDPNDVLCYFAFCALSLQFMGDPDYKKIEKAIQKLSKYDKEFGETYNFHKERIMGVMTVVSSRVRPSELREALEKKIWSLIKKKH